MEVTPRLACRQCKQRKLRCDKGLPCKACRASGLACQAVERARLPRGKSGKNKKQNQSLESRVRQLEDLIEQQNKGEGLQSTDLGHSTSNTTNCRSQSLARDFWVVLSDSISGLREVLEDSDNESDGHIARDNLPLDHTKLSEQKERSILFPIVDGQDHGLPTTSPTSSAVLFDLFKNRVDTVYKVVHLPSTLIRLTCNSSTLTASDLALQHSIYFVALCTITNVDAQTLGLGCRAEMLRLYQTAAERYLANSDLLGHPDLTVLQAFIIYLIGLRTCSNNAAAWTLVAVAARIATALRLGNEDSRSFTMLDSEVRRRAFYAVGILDTHAALDRGTIPVLPATAFRFPPLELNDDDISSETDAKVLSSAAITEMTHSIMTYKAMLCQRQMHELSRDGISTWSERLALVAGFGAYIDELKSRIGDASTPYHTLLLVSGQKIHRSLELLLRRPPYHQPSNVVPAWDNLDIMLAATEVLELHLQSTPPELTPWAWKNWVQWHALAVVLAELLTRPSGSLAERAFEVAVKSFRYYASIVADSQSGMLWKPIAKLMQKVESLKQSRPNQQMFSTPERTLHHVQDNAGLLLPSLENDGTTGVIDWSSGDHTRGSPIDQASFSWSLEREEMSSSVWKTFLDSIIDTAAWD